MTSSIQTRLTEMENRNSLFETQLRQVEMPICNAFLDNGAVVPASFHETDTVLKGPDQARTDAAFPKSAQKSGNVVLEAVSGKSRPTAKRIAVLFSGGPAAGGHNVLVGIQKILGQDNTLLGIRKGPKGLLEGQLFEIKSDDLAAIENLGGFDYLGSDRTKIKTPEQFELVKKTVRQFKLDGIIVIGGDDSNTNAAVLAEYLYDEGCVVVGVPKTIDGDLQVGELLPISFGFDTATKVYAELVGNILQDTPSSRKYWHFIKLMGRSASHVALEVALQTRPAVTLISEEVDAKQWSLNDIVEHIAAVVARRAAKGISYGVVLVPEGLIEFIPEFRVLISELNDVMAEYEQDLAVLSLSQKKTFVETKLNQGSAQLLASLPDSIKDMLLLDRDSHGNLQVSQVPTESLLVEMIGIKLSEMKNHHARYFGPGKIEFSEAEMAAFTQFKFTTNNHFFGYEGRCGAPTLFDAAYTLNLGLIAGSLALAGKTGYMAALRDLDQGGRPLAIPLTGLINVEKRHGVDEMVIKKALVDIDSPAFQYFAQRRSDWANDDLFVSPGPRQLWGPTAAQLPFMVVLNQGYDSLEFSIR